MKYRKGVKYTCAEDFSEFTGIHGTFYETEFGRLETNGKLTIKEGYACDGPSGPAIDSPQLMAAAFVHDFLYGLLRNGILRPEFRFEADMIFYKMAIRAGRVLVQRFRDRRSLGVLTPLVSMIYGGWCRFRAWYCYSAVSLLAASAADPANRRKVITVP